jgi:ABC-2 type transport system ATP-binding protein
MMIDVLNLTKIYQSGKGVFDVTFSVQKGEVFGFLGPNGAGKTTTIRQLLGFTNSDSGECRIDDRDTRKDAAVIARELGYLPGEIAFFEHMTGTQFLTFMAELRGIDAPKRREEMIERFELETHMKIRKMSKGMKQKLALVASLMHDPSILILDEPTSGLDPLMQKRFIDLICEEKQKGKTILMSSHQFEEVERTCERVAIIKDGRIVTVASISHLQEQVRKTFRVGFASDEDVREMKKTKLDLKVIDDHTCLIYIQDNYTDVLQALAKRQVKSMKSLDESLEEIFIGFYGKETH